MSLNSPGAGGLGAAVAAAATYADPITRSPLLSPGRAAVTTEHLALIGFTARLGSTVTNEDAEDTATREEARLLMSLLGKKPAAGTGGGSSDGRSGGGADPSSRPSSAGSDSALLCDEDLGGGGTGTGSGRSSPSDGDRRRHSPLFHLSCPSLSIERTRVAGLPAARPYASPIPQKKCVFADAAESSGAGARRDEPETPSELFRRPLTVSGRQRSSGGGSAFSAMAADVASTADALATNVMRSFGAAAEWRGRAWMQCLGDVLSLREKIAAQGRGERLRGTFEADSALTAASADVHCGEGSSAEPGSSSDEEGREEEEHEEESEEEEEPSNELKVIYALARSVSRIQIKSVRTSFRVLAERRASLTTTPRRDDGEESSSQGLQEDPSSSASATAAKGEEDFVLIAPEKNGGGSAGAPPPKKRGRFRQVSASPVHGLLEGNPALQVGGSYRVEHGLRFEAVLRVSLPQENGLQQEQEVVLEAPGSVRGTFRRSAPSPTPQTTTTPTSPGSPRTPSPLPAQAQEGAEVLCGVHVELDTDVLALSVERNSRLIVRRAAEADMLACAAEAAAAAQGAAAHEYDPQEYYAQESPHASAPPPTQPFGCQHQDQQQQTPTAGYHYQYNTQQQQQHYHVAATSTAASAAVLSAATEDAGTTAPSPETSPYLTSEAAVVTPRYYDASSVAGTYASPPDSFSSGGSAAAAAEINDDIAMPPPSQLHQHQAQGGHQQDPHASGYLFSPGPEGTQAAASGGGGIPPFVSPSPKSPGKRAAAAAVAEAAPADLPYAPAPEGEDGWHGSPPTTTAAEAVGSQGLTSQAPAALAGLVRISPRLGGGNGGGGGKEGRGGGGGAPSLPALVEVACAAMNSP